MSKVFCLHFVTGFVMQLIVAPVTSALLSSTLAQTIDEREMESKGAKGARNGTARAVADPLDHALFDPFQCHQEFIEPNTTTR